MDRRFVNVNYDAPIEIHLAIRSICDKVYVETGEKKKIPELYQDLVIFAISTIKPGEELNVSELSGRTCRTIFYISRHQRDQVADMLGGRSDLSFREKYDILLEYSLNNLYNIKLQHA
jgi:hypothetical protein